MKTILVAEDNESNYILMTYILKRDYQIDRAHNGQEAVDMVNQGNYDLVLMDIKMPIMDGLEATKAIRRSSLQDAKTIPIVALTADIEPSNEQRCFEAGMNACLRKPIDTAQLFSTLSREMQKAQDLEEKTPAE
jgi:CheY-like chemotaxis protein